MKAMILAAGRGQRMRPLTDSIPKPLLEVGGKPLVDHHLAALARAGITDIVINLAWRGQKLRDHLGDGSRFGVRIEFSDEGDTALEAGGGIHHALPLLGAEPFWLVNGDVYAEFKFAPRRLEHRCLGHLVLVPNPPHHRRGDFCLEGGRVAAGGAERLTYSGIAVLDPALFRDQDPGKFPLAPLLSAAARRGEISGERFDGLWHDVGTPARLAELHTRLGA